jgi:hypothetical protein
MLKLSSGHQSGSLILPYLPQSYITAAEEATVRPQLRHHRHHPTDSSQTCVIAEINIEIDQRPEIGSI